MLDIPQRFLSEFVSVCFNSPYVNVKRNIENLFRYSFIYFAFTHDCNILRKNSNFAS